MTRSISTLLFLILPGAFVLATVHTDPIGDAYPGMFYTHDITEIEAVLSGSNMVFRGSFVDPITHTESGQDSALFGYIQLWLDQDGTPTGGYCQDGGGDRAWGSLANPRQVSYPPDFVLAFFPDEPREGRQEFQAILSTGDGMPIGPQTTIWSNDMVEVQVPLTALAGDDGSMWVGCVFGDENSETDCAPDIDPFLANQQPTIPTLGTTGLIVFVASILALALFRKRLFG